MLEFINRYTHGKNSNNGGNTETYRLVSSTIRSKSWSVKKHPPKICKGVLVASKAAFTPGSPWKLSRLGTLSFRRQTNFLVPGAFCDTSSSSSELGISKRGSTASSNVLGSHSSPLSSEKLGDHKEDRDRGRNERRRSALGGGAEEVDGWGSSASVEEEECLRRLGKRDIAKASDK